MTEPPEPRRPEEGGGEDDTDWGELERNAARDFVADSTPDMQEAIDAAREHYGDEKFDEMVAEVLRRANDPMRYTADLEEQEEEESFELLDDDITLDVLGSGDDVDGDAVAELLGAWRDDVDSVPPAPGTAPENIQQIHDFTQEIDRATAPPRTQKGNTEPMSTQESIIALSTVADSGAAAGPLAEAKSTLETTVTPGLMQAVEQLAELRNAAIAATDGTAVSSGEVGSAGEHAANAIEDALELVQQAATGVEQATQHVAAFHSAARSAAERLAGS